MTRVFISHSSKDNEFTKTLRDHLHAWGYDTWLDFDGDIPLGVRWPDAIDKGLADSDVIVGIITPHSVESPNVKNEWDWALQYKKPLYLLYFREAIIPHRYVSINYIDLTRDQSAGLNHLRQGLATPHTEYKDDKISAPPVKTVATNDLSKNAATNRSRMLEKVRTFWVDGVLKPSLVGEIFLEIESAPMPEAVQPRVEIQNPAYETFTLKSGEAISEIFNRLERELLILGDPGSGKTITLLELTRDLIEQAENDDTLPIPVIFNLSSWAAERLPLDKWLVERLFIEYQVPRKVGEKWLANGDLLLLLDGLDEVILDYREDCIRAINDFWKAHDEIDNGIVVCSRINDYNMLNERLHLENAIVLRPLETGQAERYFSQLGDDWRALRDALPQNPHLTQLAQSPLLLNMMAVAYRRALPNEITGFKTENDQRRNLLERYVARRLREDDSSFTNQDTRHWLTWLAARMVENGLTVFYLESLQPTWLQTATQRRLYTVGIGLGRLMILGLAVGLLLGVVELLYRLFGRSVYGLVNWLIAGQLFGLIAVAFGLLGLVYRVVVGLVFGPSKSVTPVEGLTWSRRRLVGGLIGGLVVGLILGLIYGLIGLASPLGEWLITGLGIGLMFGLIFGLIPGEMVEARTQSNQGIMRSARSVLRVWLVSGLGLGLALGLGFGLGSVQLYGLVVGLVFGLVYGLIRALYHSSGLAVVRHYAIRVVVWWAKYTPRPDRYVAFLDDAAKRQLLRKVGGGYIFRHRMLQEYFASLETEK